MAFQIEERASAKVLKWEREQRVGGETGEVTGIPVAALPLHTAPLACVIVKNVGMLAAPTS